MKTLTCLSAWLGLLPLPLDQALRAPLQKNKSRVISRKWGNVIKTFKIVERGRKIDEEKKTAKTRERKGRALAPLSPRSSHYPNAALYYLNAWNRLRHWYHINASHYFWTKPCKKYWGLLKLYFWWVKWQVLVIHKMNQYSGARPIGSWTSTKFRIKTVMWLK